MTPYLLEGGSGIFHDGLEDIDGNGSMKYKDFHIIPDRDGWAVKAEGEERAPKTYPNKLAAVSAARRMLNEVGSGSVSVVRRDGRLESREVVDPNRGNTWYRRSPSSDTEISAFASPGSIYSMGLSDEDLLLQELASKTGESPDEVIRKALALYKAATDAVEQGKSVGIAGDPSHLESEFVGF